MAKAPFWLRGGKGKLAGSVLFKGEKGTIVRENVIPKNVQSDPQMRQRIAFGSVTQAAREMLPIIGISFEGVSSEKLNRRKFVEINSSLLGKKAKLGAAECAWTTKANNQLIPNPYTMSRGSLETPEFLTKAFTFGGAIIPTSGMADRIYWTSFERRVYTPWELWKQLYNVNRGGQVTMCIIKTMKGADHFADYQDTIEDSSMSVVIKDYIRYSKFEAPRVVLKTSYEGDFDLDFSDINDLPQWSDVRLALTQCVDLEKSDSNLLGFLTAPGTELADNDRYGIEMDWTVFEEDDDWQVSAIGAIVTQLLRNGAYTYNTCVLETGQVSTPRSGSYYGCSMPFAYQSYLPSASRNKNYLQTGGTGGNI